MWDFFLLTSSNRYGEAGHRASVRKKRRREKKRKTEVGMSDDITFLKFSTVTLNTTVYCMKTYSLAMAAKRPPLSQVKSQLSHV